MQRKTPWLVAIAFSAVSALAFANDDACTNSADSAAAYDQLADQLAQAQDDWVWVAVVPSFNEIDRDGNGVIDSSEAAAVGLDMSMADTNRDGTVTLSEYEAMLNPPSQSADASDIATPDHTS